MPSPHPGCVTWSNGNVFRSLTLLAATHCAQTLGEGKFDAACLTAENLATWMGMLEFGTVSLVVFDTDFCYRGNAIEMLLFQRDLNACLIHCRLKASIRCAPIVAVV
jgi:hypothetical protein